MRLNIKFGGYVRGGSACADGDHNRLWHADHSQHQPNIHRLKEAIAHDTDSASVEVFLDFHNQEKTSDVYLNVDEGLHLDPDTQQLLPQLNYMADTVSSFRLNLIPAAQKNYHPMTAKTWAAAGSDSPHARHSYTLEPGSPPNDQIAISQHYGAALGAGLARYFSA